jgi:hypothetical protein
MPPGLHYYDIKGSGKVIIRLSKVIPVKDVRVNRDEFDGRFQLIKDGVAVNK